jgi:hypothetical protein
MKPCYQVEPEHIEPASVADMWQNSHSAEKRRAAGGAWELGYIAEKSPKIKFSDIRERA